MKLIDKMLLLSFVINTIGFGIGIDVESMGIMVVCLIFLVITLFVGLHRYVNNL
jgi:hypothetical protein